jgi:hypothetical protein
MMPTDLEIELISTDLDAFVKQSPEKAAILFDESLKRRFRREREDWITTAKMVHYFRKHDLWRHHPAGFASFFEWAEQPEIALAGSIVSDMVAIVDFAPALQEAGIDIFEVIRQAGPSKVRALVPQIREAVREGNIAERIGPVIDAIGSTTYAEVLEMTKARGTRLSFDPEVRCTSLPNGQYRITIDCSLDELEIVARRLGIKRWYDPSGRRIESPLNVTSALPGSSVVDHL